MIVESNKCFDCHIRRLTILSAVSRSFSTMFTIHNLCLTRPCYIQPRYYMQLDWLRIVQHCNRNAFRARVCVCGSYCMDGNRVKQQWKIINFTFFSLHLFSQFFHDLAREISLSFSFSTFSSCTANTLKYRNNFIIWIMYAVLYMRGAFCNYFASVQRRAKKALRLAYEHEEIHEGLSTGKYL